MMPFKFHNAFCVYLLKCTCNKTLPFIIDPVNQKNSLCNKGRVSICFFSSTAASKNNDWFPRTLQGEIVYSCHYELISFNIFCVSIHHSYCPSWGSECPISGLGEPLQVGSWALQTQPQSSWWLSLAVRSNELLQFNLHISCSGINLSS